MANTARAKVGVSVVLKKRTVQLFEDDVVTELQYIDQTTGEPVLISGSIRVIVCNVVANNSTGNSCPPESYVPNYVIPTALIIDYSDQYDAKLMRIDIDDIIDIAEINGEVDLETVVDHAIESISNAVITEIENNVYTVVTSTGVITDSGLFETIIANIGSKSTITVTDGTITASYVPGSDLAAFKAVVDDMIPKKLEDPTVSLTLTINDK